MAIIGEFVFWKRLKKWKVAFDAEETFEFFKSPLSCLRQFLATESPLKLVKNPLYCLCD